jgi:ABC-type sugar transport system ATPase subunit
VETRIDSPRQAIKNGFAYLSGDRKKEGVYYGRSIFENIKDVVMQVLRNRNFNEDALMQKFGVKYKFKSQAIETLSGGNQQKVVTARWVGVKPRLIMADDPTKGIDVVARSDVHRIFADLAANGSSVIMSSSDDDELVKIAAVAKNYKVLVMYDGQIVNVLKGKDITISNIITSSMPRGKRV